jgi:hypothetical protein
VRAAAQPAGRTEQGLLRHCREGRQVSAFTLSLPFSPRLRQFPLLAPLLWRGIDWFSGFCASPLKLGHKPNTTVPISVRSKWIAKLGKPNLVISAALTSAVSGCESLTQLSAIQPFSEIPKPAPKIHPGEDAGPSSCDPAALCWPKLRFPRSARPAVTRDSAERGEGGYYRQSPGSVKHPISTGIRVIGCRWWEMVGNVKSHNRNPLKLQRKRNRQ